MFYSQSHSYSLFPSPFPCCPLLLWLSSRIACVNSSLYPVAQGCFQSEPFYQSQTRLLFGKTENAKRKMQCLQFLAAGLILSRGWLFLAAKRNPKNYLGRTKFPGRLSSNRSIGIPEPFPACRFGEKRCQPDNRFPKMQKGNSIDRRRGRTARGVLL